jgi:hypothetical protein
MHFCSIRCCHNLIFQPCPCVVIQHTDRFHFLPSLTCHTLKFYLCDRSIIITFYFDMQFYHHYMMCYNKFTSFCLPIFHGFQKNIYLVFQNTDTICIMNNFSCFC